MKNLAKFLLFVLLLSAGISLLYDYRLKHGGLKFRPGTHRKNTRLRPSRQSIQNKLYRLKR